MSSDSKIKILTNSSNIYLAYMVRYINDYPISADQLRKVAENRNFPRLAAYFKRFPKDHSYRNSESILAEFRSQSLPGKSQSEI